MILLITSPVKTFLLCLGSQRHFGRRGSAHNIKDDGSMNVSEGKPSKRGATVHGAPEVCITFLVGCHIIFISPSFYQKVVDNLLLFASRNKCGFKNQLQVLRITKAGMSSVTCMFCFLLFLALTFSTLVDKRNCTRLFCYLFHVSDGFYNPNAHD